MSWRSFWGSTTSACVWIQSSHSQWLCKFKRWNSAMIGHLKWPSIVLWVGQRKNRALWWDARKMNKRDKVVLPFWKGKELKKNEWINTFVPGLGTLACVLPSATVSTSCRGDFKLAAATSATSFGSSVMAELSASFVWVSDLKTQLISAWQTLLGSRGPAPSHTESIGSAKRQKRKCI